MAVERGFERSLLENSAEQLVRACVGGCWLEWSGSERVCNILSSWRLASGGIANGGAGEWARWVEEQKARLKMLRGSRHFGEHWGCALGFWVLTVKHHSWQLQTDSQFTGSARCLVGGHPALVARMRLLLLLLRERARCSWLCFQTSNPHGWE